MNQTHGKLTSKQEKFCLSYIECGNASEAYRQAYHTENMKPEIINRKTNELLDNSKVARRLLAAPAEDLLLIQLLRWDSYELARDHEGRGNRIVFA